MEINIPLAIEVSPFSNIEFIILHQLLDLVYDFQALLSNRHTYKGLNLKSFPFTVLSTKTTLAIVFSH